MPQPPASTAAATGHRRPNGEDMYNTVAGIVADVLDIDPCDIGDNATLLELGAESLMFVEIVLKLESLYGIHIERSYALPNAHTVADYIKAVHVGLAQKCAVEPS
jgi:acyl carrier protein